MAQWTSKCRGGRRGVGSHQRESHVLREVAPDFSSSDPAGIAGWRLPRCLISRLSLRNPGDSSAAENSILLGIAPRSSWTHSPLPTRADPLRRWGFIGECCHRSCTRLSSLALPSLCICSIGCYFFPPSFSKLIILIAVNVEGDFQVEENGFGVCLGWRFEPGDCAVFLLVRVNAEQEERRWIFQGCRLSIGWC